MAASADQLRDFVKENTQDSLYYTASLSPHLQGTEIVQFYQLVNYLGVKIRSNSSPVTSLSGSSQGWQSVGDNYQSFNDEYSPENYGTLVTKNVDVYTPGRDSSLGPTGKSTYITFMTSGTNGFVSSGSIRSGASIFVKDRFDTFINHYAEQRDLGQVELYDDGNPYEESDILERNPKLMLTSHPEAIVMPTSLIQAGFSAASVDGVIEALDIRRISDRSSIDLPFIVKGPKGALSVSDDNMKSYQFSDTYDLRQIGSGMSTTPYLDSVGIFGSGQALIDQPGAFSDSPERMTPFSDSARIVGAYPIGSVDATILSLLTSGVLSGSTQFKTPDTDYFPTYLVAARHGFSFSQNDNYGYDSIAFGGLKK